MFLATDTEQFEYIKSIIDESDYYVVVIAGNMVLWIITM